MSVTRERSAIRTALRWWSDEELQQRAIEAESRIQSGEATVFSPEESREWMKDFVRDVSDTRRRITQK